MARNAQMAHVDLVGKEFYRMVNQGLNKTQTGRVLVNAAKISLIPVKRRIEQVTPVGSDFDSPVLNRTFSVRNARRGKTKRFGAMVRADRKKFMKIQGKNLFSHKGSEGKPKKYYAPMVEYGYKHRGKGRKTQGQGTMLAGAEAKRYAAQRLYMDAIEARIIKLGSDAGKAMKRFAKEF